MLEIHDICNCMLRLHVNFKVSASPHHCFLVVSFTGTVHLSESHQQRACSSFVISCGAVAAEEGRLKTWVSTWMITGLNTWKLKYLALQSPEKWFDHSGRSLIDNTILIEPSTVNTGMPNPTLIHQANKEEFHKIRKCKQCAEPSCASNVGALRSKHSTDLHFLCQAVTQVLQFEFLD